MVKRHLIAILILFAFAFQTTKAQIKALPKSEKHRVVVLTDIGGDLDDEQSFTRFLMYADQFDIEGLLATSIRIFPKDARRPVDGEPQPHYLVEWINAYAQVRKNLMKHSEGWPEPDALLGMIKKGRITMRDGPFNIRTGIAEENSTHLPLIDILGEGKDTEASLHLIDVVDRDDPRPVWISIWGGSIELAQALWKVKNERSKEELNKFISKLRVYAWGHQDASGLWILENFPDLIYMVSTGGILYTADPTLHNEEWLNTNIRYNHGPLGAMCPVRKGMLGEADSETYLGLIPNGLSNMEHPNWGGWGGRLNLVSGSKTQWIDLEANLIPETLGFTICRWAPEFQNDYQARMDWCVKEFNETNHPPIPVLNGDNSLQAVEIMAKPGNRIALNAKGSYDLDKKDTLSYEWRIYPEAGNYKGQINIRNANKNMASLKIPKDALGTNFHVLLVLKDNGTPQLTRYRRLVINCQ